MNRDRRREQLRASVSAILVAERNIEERVGNALKNVHEPLVVKGVFEKARSLASEHSGELEAYLAADASPDVDNGPSVVIPLPLIAEFRTEELGFAATLQAGHTLFSSAALSYAALFELALRLFEPPLRQVAPRHLKAYVKIAQEFADLIPATVAYALVQEAGLGCHCICPMCGIGACGCVELGRQSIQAGLREAIAGDTGVGFPLLQPRVGTPLAEAGIDDGDRLLQVDGQEVQTIPEIQAALRKHSLGEEVYILIGKDGFASRELRVRHVSDYPNP